MQEHDQWDRPLAVGIQNIEALAFATAISDITITAHGIADRRTVGRPSVEIGHVIGHRPAVVVGGIALQLGRRAGVVQIPR